MNGEAHTAVEIALTNDLREIAGVAASIDLFCEDLSISPEVAYAVNLALDELLTNTIIYVYSDEEPRRIEVLVRLEGETLVVAIVDDGEAFDPTQVPESDATAVLADPEIARLGLLLVNRMMDGIEYQRRAGCNVVILTKQIGRDTGT